LYIVVVIERKKEKTSMVEAIPQEEAKKPTSAKPKKIQDEVF